MAAASVVVPKLPPPPPSSAPRRAWLASATCLSPRRPRAMLRPIPCGSPSSSVLLPEPQPQPQPQFVQLQEMEAEESRPRRIALFVEPSPFAYVSGYKNHFHNFIKNLREMGDEVIVVTTHHEGVPQEFQGAKLIGSWSYIPRYTFSWLAKPMWLIILSVIIKFLHRAADHTPIPSVAIGRDLQAAHVTAANKIRLWNKGVDSESFHPRFRNKEMRSRLTARSIGSMMSLGFSPVACSSVRPRFYGGASTSTAGRSYRKSIMSVNYNYTNKQHRLLARPPSALPEPQSAAASVLVAGIVGVSATLLFRRSSSSSQEQQQQGGGGEAPEAAGEECGECGGTGLCGLCKGEGFVFKQLSEDTATKARKAAKNMATRYTAGLPTKWTYCNKCSSTRSCTACGGSGRTKNTLTSTSP